MRQAYFGSYQIIASLGQGASAEVFKATIQGVNGLTRTVALKIFSRFSDKQAVLREARLGVKLRHPNIVQTFHFAEHKEELFIEMELVDGGSVASLIKNKTMLSDTMLIELIRQAAQGLHYLHRYAGREGGVVHADLKPSNLLLSRSGLLKITDLGTAHHPSMEDSQFVGTLAYMSPEQVIGAPLDARTDLFSLGVILYELSCGKRLFRGRQPFAIMGQIRDVEAWLKRPEILTELAAQSTWLQELIEKLLQASPADRIQSAEELLSYLPEQAQGTLSQLFTDEDIASEEPYESIDLTQLQGPFVGRRKELGVLRSTLKRVKQLFVHGAIGIGKSRLLLHYCEGKEHLFLAMDPAKGSVLEQLCFYLNIPCRYDLLQQQLVQYELIVLDDFEPFIHELPELLTWELGTCRMVFLSSLETGSSLTRIRLNPLSSEESYELLDVLLGPEQQLSRPQAEQVLSQLDGLPLAIELAAAHFLSGGESYLLKTGGLEAALQHAWSLLSSWGKDALLQLQVFEGGFREAEATAFLSIEAPSSAREVLTYLLDQAWIHLEAGDEDVVLGIYAPFRKFLRKKASREQISNYTLRLARFCSDEFFCFSPPAPFYLFQRRRQQALPSLRSAIRAALEAGDESLAMSCSIVAAEVMLHDGKNAQGRTMLRRVGHLTDLSSLEKGAWFLLQARYAQAQGDSARATHFLNLVKPHLEPNHPLYWEHLIFEIYVMTDGGCWSELDAQIAQLGSNTCFTPRQFGSLHRALGYAFVQRGNMEKGYMHLVTAHQALLTEGDIGQTIAALTSLGVLKFREEELEAAEGFYRQALGLAQKYKMLNDVEHVWMNLGLIMILMGRLEEASPLLEKAEQRYRRTGAHGAQALLLGNRAFLALIQQQRSLAQKLLLRGQGLQAHHSHPIASHTLLMVQTFLALLEGRLEDAWASSAEAVDLVRHHHLTFKAMETYLLRVELLLLNDDLNGAKDLLERLREAAADEDEVVWIQLDSLEIALAQLEGKATSGKERLLAEKLRGIPYPRPDLQFHLARHNRRL